MAKAKPNPVKKIGAPSKTDGTKKKQVTISVMEKEIKALGLDTVKAVAVEGVNLAYAKTITVNE